MDTWNRPWAHRGYSARVVHVDVWPALVKLNMSAVLYRFNYSLRKRKCAKQLPNWTISEPASAFGPGAYDCKCNEITFTNRLKTNYKNMYSHFQSASANQL